MISEITLPLKLRSEHPELLQYQWWYCGTVLRIPDAATSIWTLPDTSYLLVGQSGVNKERYTIYSKHNTYSSYLSMVELYREVPIGNLKPRLPLSQWPHRARTRLVQYLMRREPGAIPKYRALLKRSNLHPILSPLWEK